MIIVCFFTDLSCFIPQKLIKLNYHKKLPYNLIKQMHKRTTETMLVDKYLLTRNGYIYSFYIYILCVCVCVCVYNLSVFYLSEKHIPTLTKR